jgi:putative ABC transport system permease protein
VAVFNDDPKRAADSIGGDRMVTTQTYGDWRRLQNAFDGIALTTYASFQTRNERGEPVALNGLRVTSEFFPVLRIQPQVGRVLTRADEGASSPPVVVLSDAFWKRHFGGATDVVDKPVRLGEQTWRVAGVLPPGFSYPPGSDTPPDLYVPYVFREEDVIRGNARAWNSNAIARLKPGMPRRSAEEQMNRMAASLDESYPKWEPGWNVHVVSLHEHLVGQSRRWMLMLLGSVGLVLLIACANVGNLLLARGAARAREMGVRVALGAGRARLVRALLIESAMLAIAAGALGIVLAYGTVDVLSAWLPADVPKVSAIAVNWRVLAAAIAASVGTGVLFGSVPAVQTTRANVSTSLRGGDSRTATSDDRSRRLRGTLVVSELALATVLVTAGGLFVGSFINLMRVDPGFDYHRVLTRGVVIPRVPGLQEDFAARTARASTHVQRVVDALGSIPGVVSASASDNGLPLARGSSRQSVRLPGREPLEREHIDVRNVTAEYFSLLRIPVVYGRVFSANDGRTAPPVVVINQTAAARYWPGRSPIGERITLDVDREIIGVVRDIRQYGLEQPTRQGAYIPFAQRATPGGAQVLVRTQGDPLTLLAAVEATLRSFNPNQVFYDDELVTLESHLDRLIATRRFNMVLLSILGMLGLVIAGAGVFGVVAYSVTQRRREFGIRIALGASPRTILAMVLAQATVLVAAGLAIGAAAAWPLSRFATAFLFQLQATDLRVFAGAISVLAVAGIVAAAIPARRAARVDPLTTLRES